MLRRYGYSGFQHLAQATLVSRWRQGYWLMLTTASAYFDESGVDPAHQFAIVAGFVASTDMWCEFDRRWQEFMRNKPTELHWKKYIQRNCVSFAKLARTFSIKAINVTLRQSNLQRFPPRNGSDRISHMVNLFSSPYAVCSFICCGLLDEWANQEHLEGPVKVVFDAGSSEEAYFRRGYEEAFTSKKNTLLSRVPIFEDDNTVLPLQAAHLYAWLLFKTNNTKRGTEASRAVKIIEEQGHVIP